MSLSVVPKTSSILARTLLASRSPGALITSSTRPNGVLGLLPLGCLTCSVAPWLLALRETASVGLAPASAWRAGRSLRGADDKGSPRGFDSGSKSCNRGSTRSASCSGTSLVGHDMACVDRATARTSRERAESPGRVALPAWIGTSLNRQGVELNGSAPALPSTSPGERALPGVVVRAAR